ncbi:uncharacterized protein LOC122571225 [Bombus pyrosoma]|uniref:uncharacterized protein LOC122571225 n=1 Tax=Bombus pyrosoma TaxID=396416 RepID=UPI001CB9C800|nr:uncharacterized protein LOC122571225 [Bombus pyrosoma]
MSGIASATGLLEARIRPTHRPKPKHVELTGFTKPAPFILRPFSGLFNPYPYGCSILCNHPADCEAKEVLRRAKDTWATEGKALLLPEEMDMIRASLVATCSATDVGGNTGNEVTNDAPTVPEELFRKYTETDSRPLTPTPTLASGPALTNRPIQEEHPVTCDLRERITLILDLRTNSQKQMENETFSWHALTLEPPPTYRKSEIFVPKPSSRRTMRTPNPGDIPDTFTNIDDELNSSGYVEEEKIEKPTKEVTVTRRRGRRLRKGKCRRGSGYGQQTEVRDLFEPTDTQISHIGDGSRRTSIHTNNGDVENLATTPKKISATNNMPSMIFPSFIDPDILKHLCRELDSDKVEAEFSVRRKIAFEEALRVRGEHYSHSRRSQIFSNPALVDTPRVFSRQAARFEILGSESLHGLTVLGYLNKHVFVTSGRKLIFRRVFNKFQEDTMGNTKCILPSIILEALQDMIGKPITQEQEAYLNLTIGEIKEPLNFRTWCGLCAAVERLLCPFPSKEIDPPTWLERVDFESLERRLKSTNVDHKLVQFLREICKR